MKAHVTEGGDSCGKARQTRPRTSGLLGDRSVSEGGGSSLARGKRPPVVEYAVKYRVWLKVGC